MGSAPSTGRLRTVFVRKRQHKVHRTPVELIKASDFETSHGQPAVRTPSFVSASQLSLRAAAENEKIKIERLWQLAKETCTDRQCSDSDEVDSMWQRSPVTSRTGWITVRLFVASTVDDFFPERHFLATDVLRELRHWCEGEKIHLVTIDLQASLEQEEHSSEFINICLGEIDRCQADGLPMLFVGLLSETLGWIPRPEDIPEELAIKYGWIHGLSLYEMVCLHAVYRNASTNAAFMFRDGEFVKTLPEGLCQKYTEPAKKMHIDLLKKNLKERFPRQVFQYKASFVSKQQRDSKDFVPELSPDNMQLESFRFHILSFFKERIKKQFPLNDDIPRDVIEELRDAQDEELEKDLERCKQLPQLPHLRMAERQVQLYINGQGGQTPLILTGDIGAGKTGIFTRSVHQLLKNGGHHYRSLDHADQQKAVQNAMQNQGVPNNVKMHLIRVGSSWAVFHHYVGVLPYSHELLTLLQRLWNVAELQPPRLGKMPADIGQMACQIGEMLSKTGPRRLAIFINHLDEMSENNNEFLQKWLPGHLPNNIRIVITLRENSESLKVLMNRYPQPVMYKVGCPPFHDCCQLIRYSLMPAVSSNLSDTQLEDFVDQMPDHTPMALVEAGRLLTAEAADMQDCLQTLIHNIPGDLVGILDQWLCQCERLLGFREVAATLCLLHVARNGLLESELLSILGALGADGGQETALPEHEEHAAIKENTQGDMGESSKLLLPQAQRTTLMDTPSPAILDSVMNYVMQSGSITPLPGAVESNTSWGSRSTSQALSDVPQRRRSVPSSADLGHLHDSGFASLGFGRRASLSCVGRQRSSRGIQLSADSLSTPRRSQIVVSDQKSSKQGTKLSELHISESADFSQSVRGSLSSHLTMSRTRFEKRTLFDMAPPPAPLDMPSLHWAYLLRYLQPWIRRCGKATDGRWALSHQVFHWVVDMHYFQRPPSKDFPFILSASPNFYNASHTHFGSSMPRLCKTYGERRQSQHNVLLPTGAEKHVSFGESPEASDHVQAEHSYGAASLGSAMSFQQAEAITQFTQQRYGWWRERLAGFFEETDDQDRTAEELPGQLAAINDRTRLAHCLTNWNIFEKLLTMEQAGELLRLWRVAGGGKAAIPKYRHSLETLKAVGESIEVMKRRTQVAQLMFMMEEFEEAQQLLLEAEEDQACAHAPDEYLAELHLSLAKVYNEVSQRTDFQQEAARVTLPPDPDMISMQSVRTQADTTAALRSHPSLPSLTESSTGSRDDGDVGGDLWHSYHDQLQTNIHYAACQISRKVEEEAQQAIEYLQQSKDCAKTQRQVSNNFGPLLTFPGCRGDRSKYRLLLTAEALSLISSHLSLLAQWDRKDAGLVEEWCRASSQAAADCRDIYRQLGDVGHEVGALLSLVATRRHSHPQHAVQLLEEALGLTHHHLGEKHHLAGQIHQEIASLVHDRASAMHHYRRWMDVTAHLYGQQHPLTQSVRQQVCLVLNHNSERRESKTLVKSKKH